MKTKSGRSALKYKDVSDVGRYLFVYQTRDNRDNGAIVDFAHKLDTLLKSHDKKLYVEHGNCFFFFVPPRILIFIATAHKKAQVATSRPKWSDTSNLIHFS